MLLRKNFVKKEQMQKLAMEIRESLESMLLRLFRNVYVAIKLVAGKTVGKLRGTNGLQTNMNFLHQ